MYSEYERLDGKLPHYIEAIIKEYARPRYMKPMPEVMAQIKRIYCQLKCDSSRELINGKYWEHPYPQGNGCYLVL